MSAPVRTFTQEEMAAIEAAVSQRRSVRAFLDTPVPRATRSRFAILPSTVSEACPHLSSNFSER